MNKEFKLKEYDNLIKEVIESGGEFRMYPKGISMLPILRQGKDSVVLVKPTFPLCRGQIIFYQRKNGQYVLHRIVGVGKDNYVLCGDNQTYREKGVTQDMIIAVVNRIYRGDKEVSQKIHKIYEFLWRPFIIRRGIHFLGRIFGGTKTKR
ncbi:MAG: hypothetical protein HFJ03_00045 [Lachnospira sp.]|nr:hypothetical protein [Lachnospira sp.]